MTINSADFPLYDLLVRFNQPGVENLVADMERAQTGGAAEKFSLAIGLWQVANIPNIEGMVPGLTSAVKDKTVAKCAAVFKEAADAGHAGAKAMVDYLNANGTNGPSGPALG